VDLNLTSVIFGMAATQLWEEGAEEIAQAMTGLAFQPFLMMTSSV
jgi:hypothetical protein